MRRVDRLLVRVRRALERTDKQLCFGFIDHVADGDHKGEWKVVAVLWDFKTLRSGGEERITSYHSTEEEAIEAIKAVEEAHAPTDLCKPIMEEDIPIMIYDMEAMTD